ncbi:MAG: glutamyl-tRNA synthetase [Bacteroidota bacterium]|nr:glutamyl-tRNA synthetase [Bacteroidota bacterium]
MEIRVRFAPSPTGFLHIGGLRTALYNWLFAKNCGGACILRIEDTDRSRYVENAQENLVNSLKWAGIEFDESPVSGGNYSPYIQSERLGIYTEYAKKLLESGWAYYAFDTTEELAAKRELQQKEGSDFKYDRAGGRNSFTLSTYEVKKLFDENIPKVLRLKVPSDEFINFKDIIRGDISVPSKDIDDQVLLKSDGFPTYHLANVVDDHLMKISHVIRGEEWLPSTPKHILLYDAFGWEKPQFAHLPLLLNPDKSKLSKRQGSVAVEDFIEKGFLKEAIVNFVSLLGWNPGADREIYTIDELIENFNLEKVNKGGAVFDVKKLEWMNAQYIKSLPENDLAKRLIPYIKKSGFELPCIEYLEDVIKLTRERVTFLHEIPQNFNYLFEEPAEYEQSYYEKYWKQNTVDLIKPLLELYNAEDDFSHEKLHDLTKNYCEQSGIKLKEIIHPLRLMITGKSTGAGMFETMAVIGREYCIPRIEKFLARL